MKVEERSGGSERGSKLELDPVPDPWKILWIRQNDAELSAVRENSEPLGQSGVT